MLIISPQSNRMLTRQRWMKPWQPKIAPFKTEMYTDYKKLSLLVAIFRNFIRGFTELELEGVAHRGQSPKLLDIK